MHRRDAHELPHSMAMTASNKFLYYGSWGLAVGFALFFGWRIALPMLAPLSRYVARVFITDTHLNPILAIILLNLGLDLVAGLCVAITLSIFIHLFLKPVTILFIVIPVATFLGKSYWWLIQSFMDGSFYPSNAQLITYIAGPLLVALCFVISFRVIVIGTGSMRRST